MTNSLDEAMKEAIEHNELEGTDSSAVVASNHVDITFTLDKKKRVLPESFQEGLNTVAPELHNALPDFVDRTFFSTWQDLFRLANLISLEFGSLPTFADAGRAWQAAQAPDMYAFDKDTVGYTEAHQTDGVLQPMSVQEIQAKRAQGLRPMSNSQWTFYMDTAERVLSGMSILHALRDLGYHSTHKAEDVWQAAKEGEEKRAQNFQNARELETIKGKQASEAAMREAVDNGSLIT